MKLENRLWLDAWLRPGRSDREILEAAQQRAADDPEFREVFAREWAEYEVLRRERRSELVGA